MKKLISLFAIVSLLILSSSTPKRSNRDIICDGNFCLWQKENTPFFYRFDKDGHITEYWELNNHKTYKVPHNHMWGSNKWSLHDDTLDTYFFPGRIICIQDSLIILRNDRSKGAFGPLLILFKLDSTREIYKNLKRARPLKVRKAPISGLI